MNNTRNVNHHHHRRGHSFNGFANIHPFSNTNSSQGKPGKISFESAKLATSEIDDLLSSTEGGKHDYDWLLTPPETPHLPSSEGLHQPALVPPRSSLGRPMSNTHASRLSVSLSENNNNHSHSRPARSGSVTRSPSRSSSILNTRPSSPITRCPSAARPSTPTSRQTTTPRTLLPRSLPSSTNSSPSSDTNRTRTSQGSRPSTPSSIPRPTIAAISRSPSRPSTPSRRHSLPSQLPSPTRVARKPIVPPDFPLETPPNLRTTLPSDRPVSAGRSRPGAAVTLPLKPNSELQTPVVTTMSRRQQSPIPNRGRLSEFTSKSRGHANAGDPSEVSARKSVKSSTPATDNNGLGRTISKKSLDMAIRHMDVVRNGSGTLRSLSSATLYPQSIRTSSTPNKTHHTRGLSVPSSMNINGSLQSRNNGNNTNRKNGREKGERQKQCLGKLNAVVDLYESYPYDSLLLKEDLNNTNWLLHSVDEKCDIFDNGFESLPEPFGLC
ncbi:serine/arginine repetitive matrix protein 2-like [Vigna umbellata]|uniref:serine/arginine repetitive matrix protein 2-like n=1 Tax=Vigna umbellata TaxID=87088 RepID=UPI001F5F4359|nr:serine/arginine repetitive matrix protein 2-like [Vigna umbellata]